MGPDRLLYWLVIFIIIFGLLYWLFNFAPMR